MLAFLNLCQFPLKKKGNLHCNSSIVFYNIGKPVSEFNEFTPRLKSHKNQY